MTITPFSDDDLAGMQETQESAMMDEAYILVYSRTQDAGEPVEVWTQSVNPIMVGVDTQKSKEIRKDDQTIVRTSGRARLPIDTIIDEKDKLRIITRFGQPIAPIEYALAGVPERGPSGLVVDLMIVEPGVNR